MDNIFSVPGLLEDSFSNSLNPFGFNDIDSLKELDSIKFCFDEQNENNSVQKYGFECYDKDSSYFLEGEREYDHALNHDQSVNVAKDESLIWNNLTKGPSNQCKPNAITKIALLGQTPVTTNIEQSSVTSQSSHDRAQEVSEVKSLDSSSPKETEDVNDIHSLEVCNPKEKESNENIDEGNLVFLIRKIDRKTKKSKLLTKHRKKITKCQHKNLEYYAKGMCKNCYHNKGKRSKKASKCDHSDRDHYAKGLCKNCYLHFFHIKKKARKAGELSIAKAST